MADPDRGKRDFLRSLLRPLDAAVRGYEPPPGPPPDGPKRIRPGCEDDVRALLGPIGAGATVAGYRLARLKLQRTRIELTFTGARGRSVFVMLTGLDDPAAWGASRAVSKSFQVITAGDAPPAEIDAVAARVAVEVVARDHGSLWMRDPSPPAAGNAPPR
jgi:hypothetical protein